MAAVSQTTCSSAFFLNENIWISTEISLTFAPRGSINNNSASFQIMAWRRPGDKPLSEPMMISSLTRICVTRPQWVKQRSIRLVYTIYHFRIIFQFQGLIQLMYSVISIKIIKMTPNVCYKHKQQNVIFIFKSFALTISQLEYWLLYD